MLEFDWKTEHLLQSAILMNWASVCSFYLKTVMSKYLNVSAYMAVLLPVTVNATTEEVQSRLINKTIRKFDKLDNLVGIF